MNVLIEGFSIDDLLGLPESDLDALIVRDEPVVFSAGSATVLGKFQVSDHTLVLELAHIDGGGEGVLPAISVLASRYARRKGIEAVEWRVHAVNCAQPNPKLRRMLERRGFTVRTLDASGECYWLRLPV